MALINTSQINGEQLTLYIQQVSSGAAFSGNLVNYVTASGFLGNTVVYTTGGAQVITGSKRFLDSPLVPYSGGTGAAPSARWVNDQITTASTSLLAVDSSTSGYALAISGQLSAVRVTGSNVVSNVNLTGYGGTLVFRSGGFVFISGGAGGGGGAGNSNVSVTGSSTISSPNFTGAGSVTLSYDGTFVRVSGAAGADATLSGYVENNFVHRGAVDELVSGFKTFTGNPWVAAPTAPSGAANLAWTSGVSGVLFERMTGISGAIVAGSTIYNTFNITGTGTVNNTFNSSGGAISNAFNDYTQNTTTNIFTGYFTDISFYLDPVGTGYNLFETFISRDFYFTGAAFSCRTTGFGPVNGGIMTGRLYQADQNNTEHTLFNFTFQSGVIYSGSPLFNVYVTGRNRVGLSLTNSLSGIEKFTVGVFGGSYI